MMTFPHLCALKSCGKIRASHGNCWNSAWVKGHNGGHRRNWLFFHNLFNRNINNVRFISENKKWSTSLETESSEISCPPLLVIGSLKCLGVFFHLLSVHNVSTFQWQLNVALTALLPNPPLGEFATVHYHYHVRRSTSLLMFNVHFF